jgi:signal transduction histidine kinase
MIQRHLEIEQIAPWLISGASGCYVVARARQLSRARPSYTTWFHFLTRQSDVILALCGCPAAWHIARRRSMIRRTTHSASGDRQRLAAGAAHQLRQVFTVLLLGLGMISRRASDYKTLVLVQRLQRITRTGASLLSALDEPSVAELEGSG